MKKVVVHPKNKEELDALRNYLNSSNIPFEIENDNITGGLEWYEETEALNSLVNSLIGHYNVELLNMQNKRQSEEYKKFCREMLLELQQINDNPEIWSSLDLMKSHIEKYSPIAKKINTAA